MEAITSQLEKNPYSISLWNKLVAAALKTDNNEVVRETYEKLLKRFPTSVHHWVEYIEFELRKCERVKAEALFTRCTVQVLSLDIFKLYLQYCKQSNSTRDGLPRGPSEKLVIAQSYEFALNRIGYDKDSGSLWIEYIAFLKRNETHSTWEQQQAFEKIRKVYLQALSIPTSSIDQLWKEYEQFENSASRHMAKKILSEKNNIYNTSRNAYRILKTLWEPLLPSTKSALPPPSWNSVESKLAEDWQIYLSWEKSNPLQLENKDSLNARIVFAYNQALINLRFYPEIWVDFTNFYIKINKIKEAAALFVSGKEALPSSVVLNCAYAEFEENQNHPKEVHNIYTSTISSLTKDLEAVQEKFEIRLNDLEKQSKETLPDKDGTDSREIDGEAKELLRRREKIKDKQKSEIQATRDAEVDVVKRKITLVWICYMKFARRSEGIKGLRKIFSEARKSGNITYHLFVESAQMEYYSQDDTKISDNIYLFGQRFFAKEPGYIGQYLEYLTHKKDPNNIRALFEGTIEGIPAGNALPLWKKIAKFESYFGDVSNLEKTEKRIYEAYPEIPASQLFAERLGCLDLQASEELGLQDSSLRSNSKRSPGNSLRDAANITDRITFELIDSDSFTRPDFSKWTHYKPSSMVPRPIPPHFANAPPIQNSPLPMPSLAPVNTTVPFTPDLPEAVAFFLTQVPPAQDYTGPEINIDQLITAITSSATNINPIDPPESHPLPNGRFPFRPPFNRGPSHFPEDNQNVQGFSPLGALNGKRPRLT